MLLRSDNLGVLGALKKGRSRSESLNEVLKHIFRLLMGSGVMLEGTFVPSAGNVTNTLSRGDEYAFLENFPAAVTRTDLPLPTHLTDWLA